jgi:outer membrane assembly lipoprotein YfiO
LSRGVEEQGSGGAREEESPLHPSTPAQTAVVLADDAQLGNCRAYWALSPDIPRDQEFTRKAVEECTRLLEFFPRSPLVDDAKEIISKARQKLARKNLEIGKWYYQRGLYESAIIYFESTLQDYPEADVVPEALSFLYDAYDRVGFRMEAEATRRILIESYPDSPEARRLAGLSDSDER